MTRFMPLLALAGLLIADPAMALRCGNNLVRMDDSSYRVSRYCPEPFWVDVWETPGSRYRTFDYAVDRWEAWYLNFGPRKQMRRLIFRNGYLVRELELGYGFSGTPRRCSAFELERAGPSLADVYAECGPPDSSRNWPVLVQGGAGAYYGTPSVINNATWVYDFGGRSAVRILEFQDGRLIRLRRETP